MYPVYLELKIYIVASNVKKSIFNLKGMIGERKDISKNGLDQAIFVFIRVVVNNFK